VVCHPAPRSQTCQVLVRFRLSPRWRSVLLQLVRLRAPSVLVPDPTSTELLRDRGVRILLSQEVVAGRAARQHRASPRELVEVHRGHWLCSHRALVVGAPSRHQPCASRRRGRSQPPSRDRQRYRGPRGQPSVGSSPVENRSSSTRRYRHRCHARPPRSRSLPRNALAIPGSRALHHRGEPVRLRINLTRVNGSSLREGFVRSRAGQSGGASARDRAHPAPPASPLLLPGPAFGGGSYSLVTSHQPHPPFTTDLTCGFTVRLYG